MSAYTINEPVYFVGFWPDYETLFFKEAQRASQNIIISNPKEIYLAKAGFKWLPRTIQKSFYRKYIRSLIRSAQDSLFLFQGDTSLLSLLNEESRLPALGVLMRNTVFPDTKAAHEISQLRRKGVPVFSFDRLNCDQLGLTYYPQFAEKLSIPKTQADYDFCFVGRDKGRLALLNTIKSEMESLGLSTQINIPGTQKVKSPSNPAAKRILSYQSYLEQQLNCRCILDINREGQSGLTLRPIEAMLYQKKLLTNNTDIRNEALYHPHNVFVFTEKTPFEDIRRFMDTPFEHLPEDTVNQYRTTPIIQNILTQIYATTFHS